MSCQTTADSHLERRLQVVFIPRTPSLIQLYCLSRSLLLLDVSLADNVPSSPLGELDLESVEVGGVLPDLPGSQLLSPSALLPLLRNTSLLNSLLEGTGTDTSGKRRNGVRSEDKVSVGESLTGNGGGGAVNESPVVVDDLNDHGELASRRALVNEDNSANLDKTLEGRLL